MGQHTAAGMAGLIAAERARSDQVAEDWRRRHTPMAPRTRRTLSPAPVRRLGLPSERIYFAHPMPDYDTDLEARAVVAIREEFGPEFDVVNPNHPDHQAGYATRGDFSYWTDLAKSCGALVFMSLPNDWIGSGVWKEAEAAIRADRRVYEIMRDDLSLIAVVKHLDVGRCLPVEETRRTTHMILAYKETYANG